MLKQFLMKTKKMFSVTLAAAMVVGCLGGCGNSEKPEDIQSSNGQAADIQSSGDQASGSQRCLRHRRILSH